MTTIYDFHRIDGKWYALLTCGHTDRIVNRPPYIPRLWVRTAEGRAEQIGKRWRCRECEQRAAA